MGLDHSNRGHDRQLKIAGDRIRRDILPVLGDAYDDLGPAIVLSLTLMMADVWIQTGFTASEWREVIGLYDLETLAVR